MNAVLVCMNGVGAVALVGGLLVWVSEAGRRGQVVGNVLDLVGEENGGVV